MIGANRPTPMITYAPGSPTINLGSSAILTEGTSMILPGGTPPISMAPPSDSLLGGLLGAVGGFITGGPAGAIAGGIGGLMGGGGGPSVPTFAPTQGPTGILQSNPLPGIQIGNQTYNPGNILPGGAPFRQPTHTVMAAPGVCAFRGYHVIRHDGKYGKAGTYCVRNRHMNPLNPRALKRSIRRLKGFEKLARRTINAQYFSHTKSCGCKKRSPIFKKRGR